MCSYFASTDDQTGGSVQHHLQPTNDCCWRAVQNCVAVVNSVDNEYWGQCTTVVSGKWAPYTALPSQLIETAKDDVLGLSIHAEFAVNDHWRIYGGTRVGHGLSLAPSKRTPRRLAVISCHQTCFVCSKYPRNAVVHKAVLRTLLQSLWRFPDPRLDFVGGGGLWRGWKEGNAKNGKGKWGKGMGELRHRRKDREGESKGWNVKGWEPSLVCPSSQNPRSATRQDHGLCLVAYCVHLSSPLRLKYASATADVSQGRWTPSYLVQIKCLKLQSHGYLESFAVCCLQRYICCSKHFENSFVIKMMLNTSNQSTIVLLCVTQSQC